MWMRLTLRISAGRRGAFVPAAVAMMAALSCAATVLAQGPPAPNLLQVTAEGQAVRLFWDTSVFEPYRVRVDAGTAPGTTGASFSLPPTHPNTLVVSNVPSGTYYVRLRIEKDGQVSGPSNEAVVTVSGCNEAPAPPALQAESTGQTVDLRWTYTYPSGCFPSTFRLEAGRSPGASDVLAVDVPDYHQTWRQVRSVPLGTYYVRVRADRFGVVGRPSNEVRVDSTCAPPPAILNPAATVVGNAVRFSWEYGVASGAEYEVRLEAGSQPGAANIGAIPVPHEAFSGFNVAGVQGVYFTRLRATNACGSTVSPEVPVTLTPECVPPQPVPFADAAIGVGNGSLSLLWYPPASGGLVTSYEVQVGTSPGQADLARRTVDGRYTPPSPGYFSEAFHLSGRTERAYFRVTPHNTCGAARPTEVNATNNGTCWNPWAPRTLSARVTGNTVELTWDWTGPESPLETFVEIGRSPGAVDFSSPIRRTYPPPFFVTTLPSGRYYARARNMIASCGAVSNPSPEVTFDIP
jgi:hypothetical protein